LLLLTFIYYIRVCSIYSNCKTSHFPVISGSLLGGHSHHHPHHGEHHEHAHDHSHGMEEVHEGHDAGVHDHGHADNHHMMEEMMMQQVKV
jgi:hypothetical protein